MIRKIENSGPYLFAVICFYKDIKNNFGWDTRYDDDDLKSGIDMDHLPVVGKMSGKAVIEWYSSEDEALERVAWFKSKGYHAVFYWDRS